MGSSAVDTTLLVSLQRGVLTLTLNRPERRNAIDPELRDGLHDAIDAAATDADVQGVVLTGAGDAFCAGGDLARFDELHDTRTYRHVSHRLTDLIESLERLEKPVVAAVNGTVTGAGLALALACDWRVGSPAARVLFGEGLVGLVPTHGGLTRLVKLLGPRRCCSAARTSTRRPRRASPRWRYCRPGTIARGWPPPASAATRSFEERDAMIDRGG
jgi:enoyl-CoA hydratase/carnithine racemase